MFQVEIHHILPMPLRSAVDALIFNAWAHEQVSTGEVHLRVERGMSVVDPLDAKSIHVLVKMDGKLVGYGRVSPYKSLDKTGAAEVPATEVFAESYAYLSRLVIAPQARRLGLSKLLDTVRLQIAPELGCQQIFGWAVGSIRKKSLRALGFAEIDERAFFQTGWYHANRPTHLMVASLPTATQVKTLESFLSSNTVSMPKTWKLPAVASGQN